MKSKAILLLNMGGPNNLSEVKVFLNNMFNDPRIISAPSPIRRLIAWIITSRRHKEASANYERLGGASPIIRHTRSLVDALARRTGMEVRYAMRYTPPYTAEVLNELKSFERIYAVPLYPHFSSTTTLSSFDDLKSAAKRLGIGDKIESVDRYYAHPLYNASIVQRIRETLGNEDAGSFELVFSAHGLPKKVIDKGDLYQRHIRYNLYFARRALVEAGIHFRKTHLAYQSRLGPMEWIRPYLEDKLASLQTRKVIIYPIAFTVDNSETEFELEIEYRHKAEQLGFIDYRVAKAPNDHHLFVEALADIVGSMENKADES